MNRRDILKLLGLLPVVPAIGALELPGHPVNTPHVDTTLMTLPYTYWNRLALAPGQDYATSALIEGMDSHHFLLTHLGIEIDPSTSMEAAVDAYETLEFRLSINKRLYIATRAANVGCISPVGAPSLTPTPMFVPLAINRGKKAVIEFQRGQFAHLLQVCVFLSGFKVMEVAA